MAVTFVRETHYFFSCGKDKMVKYWDADRFEQILSLPAHHAEVRPARHPLRPLRPLRPSQPQPP